MRQYLYKLFCTVSHTWKMLAVVVMVIFLCLIRQAMNILLAETVSFSFVLLPSTAFFTSLMLINDS